MPAVGNCGGQVNRTIEYNNGSSHSQVVYDPQGAKLAYMSGQTLQKYMVPLAGGVQAVFNSSGLWYYRHSDWLGSSRLALDVNGNLYSGRAYAPFGESYAETGAADRSFTGQTQDVIAGPTGIYDFLFRQHSSAQGRWLVPDPAGLAAVDITNPQTWNRYAYVGNNPLSKVDPLGLDPNTDCGGPCTDFSYTVGGCSFNFHYDLVQGQGSGDSNEMYSMPSVGVQCGGGGGKTGGSHTTVFEYDDIHGTGPCKGDVDCLARKTRKSTTTAAINPNPTNTGPLKELESLAQSFSMLTHPLDVAAVNLSIFTAGGVQIAGGGLAIAGGCFEPTPFEPLTCTAGVAAGAVTIPAGIATVGYGINFFNNYTLPAFRNWGHE